MWLVEIWLGFPRLGEITGRSVQLALKKWGGVEDRIKPLEECRKILSLEECRNSLRMRRGVGFGRTLRVGKLRGEFNIFLVWA